MTWRELKEEDYPPHETLVLVGKRWNFPSGETTWNCPHCYSHTPNDKHSGGNNGHT